MANLALAREKLAGSVSRIQTDTATAIAFAREHAQKISRTTATALLLFATLLTYSLPVRGEDKVPPTQQDCDFSYQLKGSAKPSGLNLSRIDTTGCPDPNSPTQRMQQNEVFPGIFRVPSKPTK